MKTKKTHLYTVMQKSVAHTCWDDPDCEGVLVEGCAGCEEAMQHPCRYCGYGNCFATHSDEAHRGNGDVLVPFYATDEWTDAPHIYTTKENN